MYLLMNDDRFVLWDPNIVGKGSNFLRAALTQAGWAASHTKNTYLAAQQRKSDASGRRSRWFAVGDSILVIAYLILKNRASYNELGGDYFDRQNVELQRARYIRKLESRWLKVSVDVAPEAAWFKPAQEFSEQNYSPLVEHLVLLALCLLHPLQ